MEDHTQVSVQAQKELILKLKDLVSDKKLSTANIIEVTNLLMRSVETFSSLKGPQKKELVIRTLGELVNDMIDEDGEENKSNLEKFIQQILPTVIDALIYADKKGLFEKGKIRKWVSKLVVCCKPIQK